MRYIQNRLRKLESELKPQPKHRVSLAWVMERLPPERKENLAEGERVVIDWYRDYGGVVEGRERISSDPADQGRPCKRGGYLIDVIEEIHQTCFSREREGSCNICDGTPVAECRPQPSFQAE